MEKLGLNEIRERYLSFFIFPAATASLTMHPGSLRCRQLSYLHVPISPANSG